MSWQASFNYQWGAKPKEATTFYNSDFVDRIKRAEASIAGLVEEENRADASRQQAQDAYDSFHGEMRDFSTIYREKENKFGVETAFNQYEDNKRAIALAESAINALPSNINANSNVVLSQSQRNLALNLAYSRMNRQRTMLMHASDVYKDVWKKAREQSMAQTEAEYRGEYDKLQDFNSAWRIAEEDFERAKDAIRDARWQKTSVENQYKAWQAEQYSLQYNAYITAEYNRERRRIAEEQLQRRKHLDDLIMMGQARQIIAESWRYQPHY